jgi:hypothetical protein
MDQASGCPKIWHGVDLDQVIPVAFDTSSVYRLWNNPNNKK